MSDEKGFNPRYDDNKKDHIWYLGRKYKNESSDDEYRKIETIVNYEKTYLSKKNLNKQEKVNSKEVNFKIKDDVVLYETESGQQKIHCWLLESQNTKYINCLRIARRTQKGVYGSQEIVLTGEAILRLRNFLNNLNFIDNKRNNPFTISSAAFDRDKSKSEEDYSHIITQDEFSKIIQANETQIDNFYKILSLEKMKQTVKELEVIIDGNFINEVGIQKFLLDNIWMFGNDYILIINQDKINDKNILDIIPKDFEEHIDVIEVKIPTEKLFNWDKSHNNYYPNSNLTKAIAQTQNYIFELEKMTTNAEYQDVNNCKIIKPKGIILYGSKNDLDNKEKDYLRILNSLFHNLKIITYQQLLEKAKNTIVYFENQYDTKKS